MLFSQWIQDNDDDKDKAYEKDTCFPVDVMVFSYWIQDRREEKWDSGGRAIFDTTTSLSSCHIKNKDNKNDKDNENYKDNEHDKDKD